MKRDGDRYLLADGQKATALEPLDLRNREFREGYLQALLDANPAILPISRFDESFAPTISLGREILGVDNLFISPAGRLTLVETKLWRNPQAVREVLAQVVDYAGRLSELDFEALERRCRDSGRSPVGERGLFGLVESEFPDLIPAESDFVDSITRDLRNGRFLLLVVGDGIREGLERMLGALHHQSRLHFTFGLVEIRLYRMPQAEDLLAIPSVVCHSTEIERAVVTVRGAESADVQVEVRSDPGGKAPRLTEREFLDGISNSQVRQFTQRVFDWARDNGRIDIVGKSAAIRVPFSTTRKGLILMRVFPTGKVLVTPPRLRVALRNADIEEDLAVEIASRLKRIYPDIELRTENKAVAKPMQAEELLPNIEDFIKVYQAAAERAAELDPGTSTVENYEDEDLESEDD
jgi:hypothetical protein